MAALRKQIVAGEPGAVEQFWDEARKSTTPLIEPIAGDAHESLVTFVWKGTADTHNVVVFGGVAGAEVDKSQMTHINGTDVWYETYKIRNDARFTYTLSPNDSLESVEKIDPKNMPALMKRISTFKADPLNPRRIPGPIPSYVELPDAPAQSWIVPHPELPKGKLEVKTFHSKILNNQRSVWVYTPAGFSTAAAQQYPLLVLFDGDTYTLLIPTGTILDNLIGRHAIPPVVAVLIGNPTPTSRMTELACSQDFTDFLAKEIVPFMRENYHATNDPAQTIVGGSSLGGLASAFAGLRHPEVFGNVLSQSGSYWWKPESGSEPEWLTSEFVSAPKLPVRFFMEVGLMEAGPTRGDGPSMVVSNRHMRDVLRAKGYTVHYQEFNGGHEYLNWRGSLADGLIYLMKQPSE